jgi:hypothetical protein
MTGHVRVPCSCVLRVCVLRVCVLRVCVLLVCVLLVLTSLSHVSAQACLSAPSTRSIVVAPRSSYSFLQIGCHYSRVPRTPRSWDPPLGRDTHIRSRLVTCYRMAQLARGDIVVQHLTLHLLVLLAQHALPARRLIATHHRGRVGAQNRGRGGRG